MRSKLKPIFFASWSEHSPSSPTRTQLQAAALIIAGPVIPSYSDIRLSATIDGKPGYRIDAVRNNTPAAVAGIQAGDRVVTIGNVPVGQAVHTFWADLGVTAPTVSQNIYAANLLMAGRRNAQRIIGVESDAKGTKTLALENLYKGLAPAPREPVSLERNGKNIRITFNNSLGDTATIDAFDKIMAELPRNARLTLDVTETAGGGNTVVARAIMGWFVTKPMPYQIHRSTEEERQTGIPRQWIEQVLPRGQNRYHSGQVTVLVGPWTGSMGEGLAIGFAALGEKVRGQSMAGLIGAVNDITLPNSGLSFKLPVERLYAVDGTPRENFKPRR